MSHELLLFGAFIFALGALALRVSHPFVPPRPRYRSRPSELFLRETPLGPFLTIPVAAPVLEHILLRVQQSEAANDTQKGGRVFVQLVVAEPESLAPEASFDVKPVPAAFKEKRA